MYQIKKIHRNNCILNIFIAIGCPLLSIMSYGINTRFIIATSIMICAAIISLVFYLLKVKDTVKGIGVCLPVNIGCVLYSVACGGSDTAFYIVCILAFITAIYFDQIILRICVGIPAATMIVLAFVYPQAIQGMNNTDAANALFKVILYIVIIVFLDKAIEAGKTEKQKTIEMTQMLEADYIKHSNTALMLNNSVEENNNLLRDVVKQSNSIEYATEYIDTAFVYMTKAVASVKKSISGTEKFIKKDRKIAKELFESFKNVIEVVKEGNNRISGTKKTLVVIEKAIAKTLLATEDLLTRMEEIDSILKGINNVARQTSLLSYNASIEAAKVGANGRGFAVVAEDVRELSDKSTATANEIKEVVVKLNAAIKNIADKINESSEIAIDVYTATEDINSVLVEINNISNEVETIIDRKNSLVYKIGREFETIASKIIDLEDVSEEGAVRVSHIKQSISSENKNIHMLHDKMENVVTLAKETVN